jgi:drug/metabolite transporter (DMT)-like permease
VQSRPPQTSFRSALATPHVLGTIYGLFSSLIYTCANSFLTAVGHRDPVWVSAVKAVPTVVVMGLVLVALRFLGRRVFPRFPLLLGMAAGGLIGQLGGNIAFQWALSQIGVALTVPLSLGGMILCAAVLGRVFLHEPVTPKAALALAMLLAAIAVLSLGAREASEQVSDKPVPLLQVAAGVTAACMSGLAYAILNVILRYGITRGAPLPSTLFTVSISGMIALALIAWLRIGSEGMLSTTSHEWLLMLAAGLCNTAAFLSLTKSLQLTSVVWVNALNATQAAMAAMAGVLIFAEPLSQWLAVGIGLTIAGLMMLARAHRAMRAGE